MVVCGNVSPNMNAVPLVSARVLVAMSVDGRVTRLAARKVFSAPGFPTLTLVTKSMDDLDPNSDDRNPIAVPPFTPAVMKSSDRPLLEELKLSAASINVGTSAELNK